MGRGREICRNVNPVQGASPGRMARTRVGLADTWVGKLLWGRVLTRQSAPALAAPGQDRAAGALGVR